MLMEKIELEDGKYSVINENGRLRCFRYDVPWKSMDDHVTGMGFVLALVQEIETMRDGVRDTIDCLNENEDKDTVAIEILEKLIGKDI